MQKPNKLFTARVEETVTTYPSKSLGKYVKHKQVEEPFSANSPGSVLSGLGVKIPEGDHAVFAVQDILFNALALPLLGVYKKHAKLQ